MEFLNQLPPLMSVRTPSKERISTLEPRSGSSSPRANSLAAMKVGVGVSPTPNQEKTSLLSFLTLSTKMKSPKVEEAQV